MNFSVLMSVYHRETPAYLDACLASLFKQTHKATEVVLVIDGPISRELHEVIDQWQPPLNIVKVQLEKNVGLGLALKHGLKHCNYDLVARMDSDDICFPERFARQLEVFASDPELSICGSNIDEIDSETEELISVRKVPEYHPKILSSSIGKNPFNHVSIMFKKSAVVNSGSYQDMPLMEDWYLWLRMLEKGFKGYNIQQPLVAARTGKAMISRRNGFKYVTYEANLTKVKTKLFPQYKAKAWYYFLIRSFPRLLPSRALFILYKLNRR
ncbi:glycosyltransferase [Pseudoalteromonas sp. T1lg21]|uniref:glycosyltransferase n=1 Tax=Pseudoalteromonas sp. T1lg21 TaxID=2077095 RepID=UPI000CF71CDE|nr:glycosyltransferase [Pseudoalteromonas sp. T1lg21]